MTSFSMFKARTVRQPAPKLASSKQGGGKGAPNMTLPGPMRGKRRKAR
jgi:hypothetical protein